MLKRAEKVSPKADLGCSFDAKIIQLLHITRVCAAKGRDKRSFCCDHGEWDPPPPPSPQSCLKGSGTNSCEVASILALKPHLGGSKGLAYFWNLLIKNL